MSDQGNAARYFEDLNVYQRARELTAEIYSLTRQGAFAQDYGMVDQIRRAAVSVMSNIAEGHERGSKTEYIQYLYIAKGSCGEVRAQLHVAIDQQYISTAQFEQLYDSARRISGMLSNFIAHLQQSEYQGEKTSRPKRQQLSERQRRLDALRAAQEVNIRSQEQRNKET